jgi:hypothetical protein
MRGGGGFGYGSGSMMPGGMPGPGSVVSFGGEAEDPKMRDLIKQDAQLDRESHELAARIRQARGDERTKLKEQLSDLVTRHFEIRQQRREHQLERMEDELKRLRETIAKRNTSRDAIIDNHVKELVGEAGDLDF